MSAAVSPTGLAGTVPASAAASARRYGAFALRRTGRAVSVVLLAYVAVFLVLAAIPGDPISAQLDNPQAGYTDAQKEQLRSFHGLDRPVLVQLLVALGNAVRGQFGLSLSTSQPVTTVIGDAIPSTLALAGTALLLAVLIAGTLGLLTRLLPTGRVNDLVRTLPTLFLSTPTAPPPPSPRR